MLSHDKIVHMTAACSDELDEIGENGHLIHLCSWYNYMYVTIISNRFFCLGKVISPFLIRAWTSVRL